MCIHAELWLERREELGYPLGLAEAPAAPPPPRLNADNGTDAAPADLVVEIGCEELPPVDAQAAVAQLRCGPVPDTKGVPTCKQAPCYFWYCSTGAQAGPCPEGL